MFLGGVSIEKGENFSGILTEKILERIQVSSELFIFASQFVNIFL